MDKSAQAAQSTKGTSEGSSSATSHAQSSRSTLYRESSAVSITKPPKPTSNAPSLPASPRTSRETSPTRRTARPVASKTSTSAASRSRKNSLQDLSPSRPKRTSMPSPGPVQRTLSAANTPALLPTTTVLDGNTKALGPQKSPLAPEHHKDTPRWPVSPRLKSPPPTLNRPSMVPLLLGDAEAPSINVQRSTPTPSPQMDSSHAAQTDSDVEEAHLQAGTRTPVRSQSTLETVQEVSPIGSPHQDLEAALANLEDSIISEAGSQSEGLEVAVSKSKARPSMPANESGSDNGSGRAARRTAATSAPPPPLTSRQSSTSGKNGLKGKPETPASQHMTVETETVASVPQVALAPMGGSQSGGGTLRAKPSTETIRPKKEKKRAPRKQPTVNPGTASSKADIFEAKVASAVEEANSSDSEETFVYDSNPPEPRDRAPRTYHHSRTPSQTSQISQIDRNGLRSIHTVLEGMTSGTGPKPKMKFVNTFNSNGNDSFFEDDGKGTGRSNGSSSRGSGLHHHNIGRRNRQGGNSHPSLFDNESPFPHARSKFSINTNSLHHARNSSGPSSPRWSAAGGNRGGPGLKHNGTPMSAGYDLDDTTGTADDETTPLIPTSARSGRSGRSRRPGLTSLRSLEHQPVYRPPPSLLNRFATCLVLTIMLLLVVTGAIGFMFATSQPLTDVELEAISGVLASEQELMLDLTVKAHNPNVVVVAIDHADIEVFAKSPHVGNDSEWWTEPREGVKLGDITVRRRKGRDEAHVLDDPINDQPSGEPDPDEDEKSPNLRLGSFRAFDNPLTFEGSFFHQGISASQGEVRLSRPGNETSGGSERWERIINDEFYLILKGVLKYTLPLSQRVISVPISGKKHVQPNSSNDPTPAPNTTIEAT